MGGTRRTLLSFGLVALLAGCAGMPAQFENPTVSVTSFRPLPSGTMTPRFAIDLHIVNPNRVPLKLKGIAYSVFIQEHKVLTGASNKLPEIEAYGEGDVRLEASARLLESLRLLNELISKQRDTYHYKIDAKLDIGNDRPELHVVDEGSLTLGR